MLMKVQQVDIKGYTEVIVALCDKDLIGKTLKEGETELWVNPRFYKGNEVSESVAASVVGNATIVNLVGKRAVEVGIKSGIVDKGNILSIDGVPHAQMVRMRE
jgi:hypothetical protein